MKRFLFAISLFAFVVGCGGNSNKANNESEDTQLKETSGPYKVGDLYFEGDVLGVVFETKSGGMHGKIVSVDEEKMQWCDDSVYEIATYATNEYDGAVNTAKLMDRYDADKYYAAYWCADYGYGWYMPAKKELEKIFLNKSKINSTLSKYGYSQLEHWCWSSTESVNDKFCAWGVGMYSGFTIDSNKSDFNYVRAVSAF
ncbi:MAG: hypothetical protein J6C56_05175 [Alistipes sp.]|nr:hypothetical protein [Alistipes sp.]